MACVALTSCLCASCSPGQQRWKSAAWSRPLVSVEAGQSRYRDRKAPVRCGQRRRRAQLLPDTEGSRLTFSPISAIPDLGSARIPSRCLFRPYLEVAQYVRPEGLGAERRRRRALGLSAHDRCAARCCADRTREAFGSARGGASAQKAAAVSFLLTRCSLSRPDIEHALLHFTAPPPPSLLPVSSRRPICRPDRFLRRHAA